MTSNLRVAKATPAVAAIVVFSNPDTRNDEILFGAQSPSQRAALSVPTAPLGDESITDAAIALVRQSFGISIRPDWVVPLFTTTMTDGGLTSDVQVVAVRIRPLQVRVFAKPGNGYRRLVPIRSETAAQAAIIETQRGFVVDALPKLADIPTP